MTRARIADLLQLIKQKDIQIAELKKDLENKDFIIRNLSIVLSKEKERNS